MHLSGVSGRFQGGRRLASSRGRWVETTSTDGRERQAKSGRHPQLPPRSLPGLLLAVSLVLLHRLSLARNLPTTATAGPGMFSCLGHSQNLLKAVSSTLHKVSSSTSLLPPCSLSRAGASPNPGHLQGNGGRLSGAVRRGRGAFTNGPTIS